MRRKYPLLGKVRKALVKYVGRKPDITDYPGSSWGLKGAVKLKWGPAPDIAPEVLRDIVINQCDLDCEQVKVIGYGTMGWDGVKVCLSIGGSPHFCRNYLSVRVYE